MLLCRPLRGLADLFAGLPQVPLRSTWGYIYFAAPQLRIVLTQPLTRGLPHFLDLKFYPFGRLAMVGERDLCFRREKRCSHF